MAASQIRPAKWGNTADRISGYPRERAVHVSDLAATIYHALGIDPRATVRDIQGQPHQICDGYPVTELF